MSLFTEFEAKTEPARPKPRPQVVEPLPSPPARSRLSYWTLPEIDAAIADLDAERETQWDLLVPLGVLSAARLLPAEELPKLADYLHGRLTAFRALVVEDSRRG